MGRFVIGETIWRVEFVPGKNAFVTSSGDGLVHLWSFTPAEDVPATYDEAVAQAKPIDPGALREASRHEVIAD